MAAGDLITLPWQVELNGLLMGAGTVYVVREFGPWVAPEVRPGESARAQSSGVFAGRDWLGVRLVSAGLSVLAATDPLEQAARRTLAAAWQPNGDGVVSQLVWMEDDGVKYLLNGKPRLADTALEVRLPTECRFVATDPRIFAASLSTASTTPPSGASGLTFNVTGNLSFGGAITGGSMPVVNAGLVATPWVATFTGPLTDPRIEHVEQSATIGFTGGLAAGETLVVDSQARTVLLNGTASRYSWLTTTSRWFDLAAGSQTVNVRAAAGSGNVQLAWRSAWL